MKTKMIKFVGLFLSVMMALSLVPATAFADDDAPQYTWEEPVYQWAEDCSSCSAEKVCVEDSAQNITETSTDITLVEEAEPSCEVPGYKKYSAHFKNEAFTDQEKTVEIKAKGHLWGDWEVDTPAAEGVAGVEKRYCKTDPSHYEEETIPAINIEYKLWVNGTQITTSTKTVACGDGSAVYDSATNTLTLDNAEITTPVNYSAVEKALIYSGIRNLTIVLKGNSTIFGDGNNLYGFKAGLGCNLTIKGDGKLSVKTDNRAICVEGGSFTCSGATLDIESKNFAALWVGKDITFENSKIKINSDSSGEEAIVAEVESTVSSADSDVEVSAKCAAVRLGAGDEDDSEHLFLLKSGTFKLTSKYDYGILFKTGYSPDPEIVYDAIMLAGGTLDATTDSGLSNSTHVGYGDKMNFAEGDVFLDNKHIVLTDELVKFKLWVNGEQFTSEKTEIACGKGKAVYDPMAYSLTLDNAEITTPYSFSENESAMIYSELSVDPKLYGKGVISGSASYGIYSKERLSVYDAELDIKGVSAGIKIGKSYDDYAYLNVYRTKLNVTAESSTAIWAGKIIRFRGSDAKITTNGRFASAVVSSTNGEIEIEDSSVEVSSRRAAIHFGDGDEDNTEHKLKLVSGSLKVESSSDYGIFVYPYRDAKTGETAPIGTIDVQSGCLEVNSMFGATNLPEEKVTIGEGMAYTYGTSLSDSGNVVVKSKDMMFPVFIEGTPATCTEEGIRSHYADGGAIFEDMDANTPIADVASIIIPAKGHKWGEPQYVWNDDGTVTGTVTCLNDESHIETETVKYTTIVTRGPSCKETGEMIDAANFTGEGFDKQVRRTHSIEATGHVWSAPQYTWSDDFKSCTAKSVCTKDPSHVIEETSTNIVSEITKPTGEKDGEAVYTATFTNELFGKTAYSVVIPRTLTPTEQVKPATQPTEKAKPSASVKKANPATVKAAAKTVKAKKLKSKKLTIKLITVKNAQGKVKVTKVKKGTSAKLYSKIKVNPATGKITLKKGKYKKGAYKIKLKITVAGNSAYNAKTITKTVKLKIK